MASARFRRAAAVLRDRRRAAPVRPYPVAYAETHDGAAILQVVPGTLADPAHSGLLAALCTHYLDWVTVRAIDPDHALTLGREAVADTIAEQHERRGTWDDDDGTCIVATRLIPAGTELLDLTTDEIDLIAEPA